MDTEVILNNNSITLSFKKQLNNSQIYQLNYFGFNQSNLDKNDIFYGRINESKLVERNFIPKTAEDRLLISPPQKNLEIEDWSKNNDPLDIESIKQNLEKLL